jgi:hypothetical protein
MKKVFLFLVTASLVVQLAGCASSPKTQSDHYRDLQNGTIYKTYQKVSVKAMKPVVKEYNRELAKDNRAQVGETHVHALLGFIWLASSEPDFALAEADYALGQARDPRDRYNALAIQALAMHQQGWYHLARQKSTEAGILSKTHGFSNRYTNILALVHVSGAALAAMDYNIPHTISAVREAGEVLDQKWIVQLGDGTQEVYDGANTKAIARLERLQKDPKLSDKERQGVGKVLAVVKKGGKDVSINMAKAVAEVLLEASLDDNSLTPLVLKELPEQYRDKIAKYL